MADLLSDADIGISPSPKGEAKGGLLSDADIGLSTPVAVGKGEKQAVADEVLVAKERGYIPDAVKTFARSAADTALFGGPTHAMALTRSYSENIPYQEALAKERAYRDALERQNPKSSMAGTGIGIVGGLLVPAGPIGAAGMRAAQLAGRLGAGATGKAAASGATIGAGFGGLSGAFEKYGTDQFTPGEIAKSAAIGGVGGAALGSAAEKVLGRSVAPEYAAKAAILESQGVPVSRQMVTGIAAPEGAASKTAEEMATKAKEILEQKRQSLIKPEVSQSAGAEALQAAGQKAFKESQAPYKALEAMPESFTFKTPGPSAQGVLPFAEKDLQDVFKTKQSAYTYINDFVRDNIAAKKVNPNWQELTGNYPAANDAQKVLNIHLNHFDNKTSGPTFADILEAKKKLGESYRLARTTDDSIATQAIIDGYKNAVNQAVIDGLFMGDKGIATANMAIADKGWSQYIKDFNPKKGAESSIFKGILGKMVDPDTGYLAQNLTPEMAQAAQGMIDAKIIDPNLGPSLYKRLQRIVGTDTPAMQNFNSLIKNQMLTPKNGDLSLLPKQIAKYTDSASLPVTLQAFGAKGGNLRSLAANASDSVETVAAKKQLLDLQNMSKAIEIINARPVSDDAKKSMIGALLKKTIPAAAGAAFGYPFGGVLESIIGGVAGKTLGEIGGGVGSIAASRAQRAGAPKTMTKEGQGFDVPKIPYSVFPVVKDFEELAPAPKESGYRMPRPLTINGPGSRVERKAGGRVSDRLIREVERAKKSINSNTESLLNTPDSHVAHALEIANRNLEG